ncbi:battenin-like [Halyomorpha halys]|uniref:battenin-like n=1 Tax=Halyomorpha halys TaxID=286706 RepID=UPI0034D374A4
MPIQPEERSSFRSRKYRNVIIFWFLGLANNYGYVVMLSAAHDILADFNHEDVSSNKTYVRECNTMSTGIILLADIMPSILVKIASPFMPLCIYLRMAVTIGLAIVGFVLVAIRLKKWVIILGVVCTSLSSGLGESSLLSYIVFFKTKNVISTWSSGTGGAGIVGSVSYAALTTLGLEPVKTLLAMLIIPVIEAILFFICLDHPKINNNDNALESLQKSDTNVPVEADILGFRDKLRLIPRLLVTYMAPFGLVYLFEYFINQGLFELLYFPQSKLSHSEQYRWYSVLYQIGVFASRSSMNLININNIWFIALLQFLNVVFCLFEVFYGFVTYLPLLMLVIFWEGILGGASYVNTYRRINNEVAPEARQFSMAMNTFADAVMITCAGLIAYPVHNVICTFPSPYK